MIVGGKLRSSCVLLVGGCLFSLVVLRVWFSS